MALSPLRGDLFDPFSFSWDPFLSSSIRFPFAEERAMSSLLHSDSARDALAVANTQVDWKETPEAHIFKADLPGLKKEEIKVEVEDGRVLSIRGECSKEKTEETDTWHRVERSRGTFMRKFRLPEDIKDEEMKAAMENGVLTITIPKAGETKKHDVRTVQIA